MAPVTTNRHKTVTPMEHQAAQQASTAVEAEDKETDSAIILQASHLREIRATDHLCKDAEIPVDHHHPDQETVLPLKVEDRVEHLHGQDPETKEEDLVACHPADMEVALEDHHQDQTWLPICSQATRSPSLSSNLT